MQALISKLAYWIVLVPLQGGFFSSLVNDVNKYVAERDWWGLLSDPRVAIILGLMFLAGILLRTKVVPLLIFAVYGYTLTFHLSAVLKAGSAEGEDFLGNLDSIIVFLIGFAITTGVIIYFTLLKGE